MVEQTQVKPSLEQDQERGPTMHTDLVHIIVAAVMEALRTNLGGRRVYVPLVSPAKAASEIKTRDDAIRAAFNGRNIKDVCRQFEVSRATVYRITSPKRRLHAKKRAHGR
jgi:Mor family transcriptional regulator